MKTDLQIHSAPTVGNTVFKLALVGSILLSLVYGVLKIFASAIAVFQ